MSQIYCGPPLPDPFQERLDELRRAPLGYAYIGGALTDVPQEIMLVLKSQYEKLGKICESFGLAAHVPHLFTDPVKHAYVLPGVVVEFDYQLVMSAQLCVMDLAFSSAGTCKELGYADTAYFRGDPHKPEVLLLESAVRPVKSRMVIGSPALVHRIAYKYEGDLFDRVSGFMETYMQERRRKDTQGSLCFQAAVAR